jgi:hypothetical protein
VEAEECALARAVRLIAEGRAEEAIEELSRFYNVPPPRMRVGLPRRCRRALGCYVAARRTIYLRSSDEYVNPFVVLHEFYHHIRSVLGKHRGTERHADAFALRAIEAARRGACGSGRDEEGSSP